MPTNPSDIPSYAFGAALNSASYSGGAGGTFPDLVNGRDWTVVSATPTFATRDGLEGMVFSNSSTEAVTQPFYSHGELTVVAIFQFDNTSTHYIWGGTETAVNQHGIQGNAHRIQAFSPFAGSSGYTATHSSSRTLVGAASWSFEDKKLYATTYDGTLRKASATATGPSLIIPFPTMAIGAARTTYITGWIAEVHGFHRALHLRDETALDDMILTLAAKVGL